MSDIVAALSIAWQPYSLLVIALGTLAGIIIGALPGLSVNMGIALLFPLTFAFDGVLGILMLLGIYCGAVYGGSISAILLNTPGTPASAATIIDGYPMANKMGQPGRALGISTFGSMFGGVFSCCMLMLVSPALARVALSFGAPEYFSLALFGISIITGVSGKSIIKGLMGGVLGLLIGTIGTDPMTSMLRFTFDSTYLMGGVSFVPVLIGLFAFSQGMLTAEDSYGEVFKRTVVKIGHVFPNRADLKRILPTVVQSSLIGTFIGAVPGTGGDVASFASYSMARKVSKHKELFGTGVPEGIAAPEAGNNAVCGGAMVPLLTLGIPGDGATAIILGSFLVQGLAPGPLLFTNYKIQVFAIFAGLMTANIIMGILGFSSIRLFARVVNVPKKWLVPIIFMLTSIGAFAINNSVIDIFVMMGFGVLGFFLIKLDFTMSPIVIGLILGTMAETNLRRALLMSDGDYTVFFTRPIALTFIILSILSLCSPLFAPLFNRMKTALSIRLPKNTKGE